MTQLSEPTESCAIEELHTTKQLATMATCGAINAEFTRKLPKIELHAHLSGSISRKCLHEIWEQKKATNPSLELEDPFSAIPPGKVDYDLKAFFPLFSSYIYKLCSDLSSIEYSTNSVLNDFQSDGVAYLELRTTPRTYPDYNISKDIYIRTVLSSVTSHNENPSNQMHTNLILSIDRCNTLPEAEEVVDLAVKYQSKGVVGVDLCGNPSKGEIRIFAPAFARAKESGLKLTLHFAETPLSATDDELDTMLNWKPDRLGHVIHVNQEIRERVIRQKIGVELCLSCNVHTKMITGSYPNHHFGWWMHSGVGVALGTDDVGVFCSPLSQEYYLAATHFNLTMSQLKKLCEEAVEIIFGGLEEKERLRALYRQWDGWVVREI